MVNAEVCEVADADRTLRRVLGHGDDCHAEVVAERVHVEHAEESHDGQHVTSFDGNIRKTSQHRRYLCRV